jgi:hypothetical protein
VDGVENGKSYSKHSGGNQASTPNSTRMTQSWLFA